MGQLWDSHSDMASITPVSFTSPLGAYGADAYDIQRRQKLADMLEKQSMEPLQTNRMAGRFVVPISPWEGANKVAQGAAAGYMGNQAQERQRELVKQLQGDASRWYGNAPQARPASQPGFGGEPEQPTGGTVQPTQQDRMGHLMQGMNNPFSAPLAQMQIAQLMKESDPYTLAEGAQRRGPAGIIAENPKDFKPQGPMVEHNFPVSGDKVQPHISHDQGKTWTPIPGSQPIAKFGRQVVNVNTGEQPVPMTEDTLGMDAWRYLTDGTLPTNMGRGVQGAAQATKIRNESSRLAKEMGMEPDEIRMAQMTNKTQVQAIGQLARAKAQILQFEKTAMANADLALKASSEMWRSDSPWFNKPLQATQAGVASDPKLAVFHAANETFISEYARVMSGGYGAAQTTDRKSVV